MNHAELFQVGTNEKGLNSLILLLPPTRVGSVQFVTVFP